MFQTASHRTDIKVLATDKTVFRTNLVATGSLGVEVVGEFSVTWKRW